MRKMKLLMVSIPVINKNSKLRTLYDYLEGDQAYLVHQAARVEKELLSTVKSQKLTLWEVNMIKINGPIECHGPRTESKIYNRLEVWVKVMNTLTVGMNLSHRSWYGQRYSCHSWHKLTPSSIIQGSINSVSTPKFFDFHIPQRTTASLPEVVFI